MPTDGALTSFDRFGHTVDAVIFGVDLVRGQLDLLLIERGIEPYRGSWALPGGFVRSGESLSTAVERELLEETGVSPSYLEQLYTYGDPHRDPRGQIISTAYLGLIRPSQFALRSGTDAANAQWWPMKGLPTLAFDHSQIIDAALERLRSKLPWQPVGVDLLPTLFSLSDLQQIYEIILGRDLDKRNFRRKILSFEVLIETEKTRADGHRPARLYRFDRKRYRELRREGRDFEL